MRNSIFCHSGTFKKPFQSVIEGPKMRCFSEFKEYTMKRKQNGLWAFFGLTNKNKYLILDLVAPLLINKAGFVKPLSRPGHYLFKDSSQTFERTLYFPKKLNSLSNLLLCIFQIHTVLGNVRNFKVSAGLLMKQIKYFTLLLFTASYCFFTGFFLCRNHVLFIPCFDENLREEK